MNYKRLLKVSFAAFPAFVFILVLCNFSGLKRLYAGGNPSTGNDDDKPVEEVYKNIQVLKGMPKKDFITSMHFFRSSLGVGCAFCHVYDEKTKDWVWESDDKEQKKTAREMIQMVEGINKDHFRGFLAVSCYTCHQGHTNISRIPPVPQNFPKPEEEGIDTTLPKGADLVDNYLKSLGDISKIEKSTTRYLKGTIISRDGKEQQVEIYQQAPDKYLQIVSSPQGTNSKGFDGTTGWMKGTKGVQELDGSGLKQIKDLSDFTDGVDFKTLYTGFQTYAKDTLNGKDVYIVRAKAGDTRTDRLYFDVNSGLLLRRTSINKTTLFYIPYQTDYDDYRMTDGVLIPYHITYSYLSPWDDMERKFTEIKYGVSVDNVSFAKPDK